MFRANGNSGFQITFSNGYTLSVQFGPGNYVSNRSLDFRAPMRVDHWESVDAEVAAWPEPEPDKDHSDSNEEAIAEVSLVNHSWVKLSANDSVQGWVNADKVAKLIWFIANLKSGTQASEVPDLQEILNLTVFERLDFTKEEDNES